MDSDWISGEKESLIGSTRAVDLTWYETAVARRGVFEEGLRNLRLPEHDINQALDIRDTVSVQVSTIDLELERLERLYAGISFIDTPEDIRELWSARVSVIDRLRNFLAGRTLRVDDVVRVEVRVPLFLLSAPNVDGCSAGFAANSMKGKALEWSVKVFGTGFGGSSSVSVTASWKFTVAQGEAKVIFIPASVTVAKVSVLENSKLVSQGHQVDASGLKTTQAPGLVLLSPNSTLPIGDLAETFPLSGDTSGAVATYEYLYTRSDEGALEIGAKAFNVDIGVKAQVNMSETTTLTYNLRGGYDYELRRLSEGDGLFWTASR